MPLIASSVDVSGSNSTSSPVYTLLIYDERGVNVTLILWCVSLSTRTQQCMNIRVWRCTTTSNENKYTTDVCVYVHIFSTRHHHHHNTAQHNWVCSTVGRCVSMSSSQHTARSMCECVYIQLHLPSTQHGDECASQHHHHYHSAHSMSVDVCVCMCVRVSKVE